MSENDFLKDLQKSCLKDCHDQIGKLKLLVPDSVANPLQVLRQVMRITHTIKGNAQACGFNFLGEYIHDFETILQTVQKTIEQAGTDLVAADMQMLEFLLSDAFIAFESYVHDLERTENDAPEFKTIHGRCFKMLQTWRPSHLFTPQTTVEVPETSALPAELIATIPEAPPESIIPLGIPDVTVEVPKQATPAPEPIAAQQIPQVAPQPESAAQEKEEEPLSNTFLLIQNQNRQFALEISSVREIVEYHAWTALPLERPDILGLLNLRGEVIPILNLTTVIGEIDEPRYIVVCRQGASIFGFPVHRADQVTELDPATFQSPRDSIRPGSNIFSHFALRENETILVLDMRKALAA